VALAAGGFVLVLVVLAILAPYIAPFDAENYFDYDTLNSPRRPGTGSASTRSDATSSAGC